MATNTCAVCAADPYKNGNHPCSFEHACSCWRSEPCKRGTALAKKQGNSWMVAYRATTQRGNPIGGGVARITGRTLKGAQDAATMMLRARFDSPRANIEWRDARPCDAP